MRLPPSYKFEDAVSKLREILTASSEETFGAEIEFEALGGGPGFLAQPLPNNL